MTFSESDTFAIAEQLAICLAWCGNREMPPAKDCSAVFRSAALATQAASVFPDSCHTEFTPAIQETFTHFLQCRNDLANETSSDASRELSRPRALLAFNWRSSLFDGAATPQTFGFVNDDYMPAWDTWLHILAVPSLDYDPYCLISWVPTWLAPHVNSGIAVDPAESMSWCHVAVTGEITIHGWGKMIGDFV